MTRHLALGLDMDSGSVQDPPQAHVSFSAGTLAVLWREGKRHEPLLMVCTQQGSFNLKKTFAGLNVLTCVHSSALR